jgi:hypothetical protein
VRGSTGTPEHPPTLDPRCPFGGTLGHISAFDRHDVYRFTRPYEAGQECPHDREPDDCEAVGWDQPSKCPSSVSPHATRRGAITNHLNSDVPANVVGDRANVSTDVLDQHDDQRTERERMEQRRGYLADVE